MAASSPPPREIVLSPSSSDSSDPWINLLRIRECFGYQIPPRVTEFYCEKWGLDKPIFTGELHVLGKENKLIIRLKTNDGVLFSDSIELNCLDNKPLSHFIEPVKDSSRYFVIRLKDPTSGRKIDFGIGFRERSDSFDLNATINDKIKQSTRHNQLEKKLTMSDEEKKKQNETEIKEIEERLGNSGLNKNMAIPEGSRIKIEFKAKTSNSNNGYGSITDNQSENPPIESTPKKKVSSIPLVGGLKLAPPPTVEESIQNNKKKSHHTKSSHTSSTSTNNNNANTENNNNNTKSSSSSSNNLIAPTTISPVLTSVSSPPGGMSVVNSQDTSDEDEWAEFSSAK